MRLFHTGFLEIKTPDIYYGRKNADFGQGFYLTDDMEFSRRWAKERKGETTICNTYELNTEGLSVKEFSRSEEWFDYINKNRNHKPDELKEYDIIMGPIANDTIYDVMGIITSGYLDAKESLQLLMIGPEYHQITIKSEKAAAQLEFLSSEEIVLKDILKYRELVAREEADYQELFARELERLEE
ncbi:MAG: DUF3990 domain-containing protein [Lachnospiraceae bacterium]|nr:DUF3990 domain-containing protein [Lachnospiraceae bacterium]